MTTNYLEQIQARFCLIDLSGTRFLLDQNQIKEAQSGRGNINYYRKPEGILSLERFIESQKFGITERAIKELIKDFWRSPDTKEYKEVAFHPDNQGCEVLNFWVDPIIKPREGDIIFLEDFILKTICDGNNENFKWLIGFLAHMLQKPAEKPSCAVVLLGGQGVGKGAFLRLLQKIWPHTMLEVSDVDDVIGHFNASLERSYAVWMDEAIFTHDKRSMERLKSLISEPTVRVEQKYEPKRTIKSVHRIFAASNKDHFSDLQGDDRRFFVLRVSNNRKQNHDYFRKFHEVLDDGESVAFFMHALLSWDLSGFNVHGRPKTEEHNQQKLKSLQGLERFFFDTLLLGEDPRSCSYDKQSWSKPFWIATQDLKQAFTQFDKNASRYRAVTSADLVTKIKEMCPSAKSERRVCDRVQRRGISLPSLTDAREEFDSYIGFSVDWES